MAQYLIKSGDTLSAIAQKFGYGGDYMSIAKANNIPNPNLILAGQTINIPDRAAPGNVPASSLAPTEPIRTPQSVSTPSTGGLTADILRTKFGFNDPNVINNILNDPNERARYEREAGLGGSSSPSPGVSLPSLPTIDLQSIYEKALTSATTAVQPEIDASAGEVNTVQARIAEKRRALAQAEADINDNPYFSEATRTGRIAKLREKAQADISIDEQDLAIAQNKTVVAQNKVAQAKADAQVKLNIASQQYNIQSQQYQQNLQLFTTLLTSGALETASGGDIAQIATSTGMSTSMIQSIIDATKKKNAPKPSLITSDDGTNQYVVAIDSNTGSVIKKEIIGKSAPKTTGTTETTQNTRSQVAQALNTKVGADGHVSEQVYLAARQQWVSLGYLAQDFDKAFSNYVNPNYWESYNLVDPDTVKRFRGY